MSRHVLPTAPSSRSISAQRTSQGSSESRTADRHTLDRLLHAGPARATNATQPRLAAQKPHGVPRGGRQWQVMASPASSPSAPTFATLPSHLLEYLFGHLRVRDLLAVSAVCRAWHRAAAGVPYWRERVAEMLEEPLETSTKSFSLRFGRQARDVYFIATRLLPWHQDPARYPWLHHEPLVEAVTLLTHLPLGFDALRHIEPDLRSSLRLFAVLWAAKKDSTLLLLSSTCRCGQARCYC